MPKTKGLIEINAKNVDKTPRKDLKKIGLCPQDDMVFADLSVTEHLYFFARVRYLICLLPHIQEYFCR